MGQDLQQQMTDVLNMLRQQGVDYADIRVNTIVEESIATENMKVQNLTTHSTKGYGIKVYLDGSMGFAGSPDFSDMEKTALMALELARASRIAQRNKVILAPKTAVRDTYSTPIEIDPFTVSKEEKIRLLFEAEAKMKEAEPRLFKSVGFLSCRREQKVFADTEASYITQTLYETGGGIEAIATNKREMQRRTFPNSARGNFGTAGYEFIRDMNLTENAAKIAREAVALVEAEDCPAGYFDLIILPSQLTLQIHESIGHPIELDRVFGYEAGYAGTSFLNPGLVGFKYGSHHVNIVADATTPKGLGSFGYDDEGIKAQSTPIITGGIFNNFLSSRDTASVLRQESNGTARADGWARPPIVRMTNINLLPGTTSFAELLAGVDDGLLLDSNKSWSIDDKRLNFQFACEIAYEIKGGQLTGKIYKNPIYTGITPEFWGSCDGVADGGSWQLFGTPNCGKGEPGQMAHVGHGSSPARFRKVKVGVADVK